MGYTTNSYPTGAYNSAAVQIDTSVWHDAHRVVASVDA
jgi:hypothetical protein